MKIQSAVEAIHQVQSIQEAILVAKSALIRFASSPSFSEIIITAFGRNFSSQKLSNLHQAWQIGRAHV